MGLSAEGSEAWHKFGIPALWTQSLCGEALVAPGQPLLRSSCALSPQGHGLERG